jgi:hypothetical protein
VLLLAGLGLLVLASWASGGEPAPPYLPPPEHIDDAEDLFPTTPSPASLNPTAPPDTFPPDPALGSLRITKFFFKTIDPVPGPPEPEVFADELCMELYEPDSRHSWQLSYFVATPEGLTRILREKSWRYLFANEVLVFPRYDLDEIRRAVVARILADQEYFKGSKQNLEEEAL